MDFNILATFKKECEYYSNKLYKAWKKHGKIIICVDFDDTIRAHHEECATTVNDAIFAIQEAQQLGATVILYTCRGPKDYKMIEEYCKEINFNYDILNPTEPFKDGYSTKPYCNILLDDKAGLEQSILILMDAIEHYKLYKYETEYK